MENVNDMAHEVAERTQAAGSSFADMVRRHPLPTTLIAAGIALLAAGGGVGVRQRHQDDEDSYSGYGGRYGYGEGDYGGYVRPGFSSDASAATGYEPQPQADPQGYSQGYGQGYAQDYDRQDFNRRFEANYGSERGFESYGAYDSGYDTGYKPAANAPSGSAGYGSYDADTAHDPSGTSLGERAGEVGAQAGRQVKDAGRGVVGFIEDQPLVAGFVTAILGVLIGLAFPGSRRENELMGGARDHLAAQAREAAERARQVAQKTFEEARETARQEFSDLGAEAKEDGQDLAEKGKAAAKRVADAAAGTAKETAKESTKETTKNEAKSKPQSN